MFLSHIREISAYDAGERQENEVGRPWIVCNYSIDHPDAPVCSGFEVALALSTNHNEFLNISKLS